MRDPRIKRPCPFCDETEHLSFQESSCPWPIFEGGDTLKDEDGHDVEDYVDGVYCMACDALVPMQVLHREIAAEELVMLRDFGSLAREGSIKRPSARTAGRHRIPLIRNLTQCVIAGGDHRLKESLQNDPIFFRFWLCNGGESSQTPDGVMQRRCGPGELDCRAGIAQFVNWETGELCGAELKRSDDSVNVFDPSDPLFPIQRIVIYGRNSARGPLDDRKGNLPSSMEFGSAALVLTGPLPLLRKPRLLRLVESSPSSAEDSEDGAYRLHPPRNTRVDVHQVRELRRITNACCPGGTGRAGNRSYPSRHSSPVHPPLPKWMAA